MGDRAYSRSGDAAAPPTGRDFIRACLVLPRPLALGGIAVGGFVLLNYAFDSLPLWRPFSVQRTAHPWTALCLVGLGLAAWPVEINRLGNWQRAVAGLVAVVLAFGIVTALTTPDPFSRFSLFSRRLAEEAAGGRVIGIGLPAIVTVLALLVSLFFFDRRRLKAAQLAAAVACIVPVTAFLGMVTGASGFYGQLSFVAALGTLLIALAMLARSASARPLRDLLQAGDIGRVARRRLCLVAAPIVAAIALVAVSDAAAAPRLLPILSVVVSGVLACIVISDVGIGTDRRTASEPLTPREATLQQSLAGAWERAEMFLLYQPQVDLATGVVVGAEALARWEHPTEGPVPPGQFIPMAERDGSIHQLGRWILAAACREAVRWSSADARHQHLKVSVNVSPHQLTAPDFVPRVADILKETGLPVSRLVIEVTENAMVREQDGSLDALRRLHEAGVQIAIDDFGTGYSSLSYLRRLPSNFLKIDRSFVMGLPDDEGAATIARTVIAMGRSLGLRVIAEGVETEEQAELLRSFWCDLGQGYLYARALPADEFLRFASDTAGKWRDGMGQQTALSGLHG